MPERITRTQRWLDLISYLAGRRLPAAVDEIMERIPSYAEKWRTGKEKDRETARRTFERDKDELRRAGIPLETVRYSVNHGMETLEGYRISRRDFYLPYLRLLTGNAVDESKAVRGRRDDPARVREVWLQQEDAQLALDALWSVGGLPGSPLARDAASAVRKIGFDLDDAGMGPPVVRAVGATPDLDQATLRTLSNALMDRRRVRFRYYSIGRDTLTDRNVAPYGLFFRGDWYLVGHDESRDAVRVFRVARISQLEHARPSATEPYTIPENFRLEDYVDREAWALGDENDPVIEATVLFHFPMSLWAARNGYGDAVGPPDGLDSIRRFSVRQVDAFLRWVLGMAGDAEIVDPPELRREYLARAERMAAMYGPDPTGDG